MADVLDTYGSVVLDAKGYGFVSFTPESFRTWRVTIINVRTDQGPTQVPIPQATVYLGSIGPGQIVSQTWMGNRSTASGEVLVQPSQQLIVEWANGVPGSRATASIYGTQTMR
ncbi:hypothetical protein [Streptomyces sp. NPDC087787]|uniref:hypothetical protein n=1 Tax=Streptomyces sp. NPDC087787 TaxID=3365803 RepID=UPI003827DEBB